MPNTVSLNATRGTLDANVLDILQTWQTATISSGAVAFSGTGMTLDTQSAAATDDLDTLTASNVLTGFIVALRSTSTARVITIKDQTGNFWLGGRDIVLDNPRRVQFFMYDGAYWVPIGCCGDGATPVEVIPDSGEDSLCVIAARLVGFIDYVVNQVAEARAGGLVAVTAALTAALRLANPSAVQDDINALALEFATEYADDTEVYAAFTTTVFDNVQCSAYCTSSSGTGTSEFVPGDIPILIAFITVFAGVPYVLISEIVEIIGADGLTRAVGLSMLAATTMDCSGGCACTVSFEWEEASQETVEGETVYANVVLRIDGGGSLASNIDVDITTAGTATGGGDDYTLVTTTVTFTAGSVDGDMQAVQVNVDTDALSDDNETIILGLDPDSGDVGSPATHTILIGTCYTFDFTVDDGGFVAETWNGFWETANGWRTGATAQSGGYRFRARFILSAAFNVGSMTCNLAGGFADAYVFYYNSVGTLLYTWSITAGGSGSSFNSKTQAISAVKEVVIQRGVTTGSYSGPAYMTTFEMCK